MGNSKTNLTFTIVAEGGAGASVIRQAPFFSVPQGCTVSVRAHNGLDDGNAHPVSVAASVVEVKGKRGELLQPGYSTTMAVTNVNQIFARMIVGDGIVIAVKG